MPPRNDMEPTGAHQVQSQNYCNVLYNSALYEYMQRQ